MAWIDPRYEEGRRKYWMRPDAYRFAPPGSPEAKMPGYLHPWAAVARAEAAAEDEARARAAAEQEEFERELLHLRWEVKKLKLEHELWCFEQKYSPNQPRVPAGSREGGQWVSDAGKDGGSDSLLTEPAALRRAGHHYVARQVYKSRRLSEDTRKVFEEATSGRLEDKRTNVFNSSHRAYNKAVNEQFDRFLTKNNITEEQMTPDHARQLLGDILTSRDPRIRNFNMRIWMREIFRGGRFRGNE